VTSFRKLGEQEVYRGRVVRLVQARFEDPDGEPFERDVVHVPGAVAVVPVLFDPEGVASIVLVRQYRPAIERDLLEIPAGLRDVDGEAPEDTARRELAEETGFAADSLAELVRFHNTAGMSDSHTIVYLASGLSPVERELHGPEERHMVVEHVPLVEAAAMVIGGSLTDAKTVIGVLLTERWLAAQG
jgi:ADP-ribose pyrophosphatase